MGTVGLSFGSPTSGTGFDVSSTVAQIVSNLQKVETPWKTQVTTLQNQDSAISNLGTLLSKLSNDMSSLTDFNGILAQKTGSSSDTSVLELTSASNSATAGNHTVVVNSLATTSSGNLAEITNASDTLTGSITLQVGNGTSHVISLPSGGGTLSDLASAVNSSGVGITASVLTDSTGSRLSLVSGTSGAGGNITVSANSVVDRTLHSKGLNIGYTDTTSGGATSIGTLASTNASDTLTGDLSITGPDGTVTDFKMSDLGSNANLAGLASAITSAGIGVAADLTTNNGVSTLSLVSTGTMSVTSNLQDPSLALGYNSTVSGADASLTVDGVDLKSASNTVSNLIPGLTFQLLQASPKQSGGSQEPIQIIIGNDNTGVESTINTMVSDYNSLVSAINTQEGVDSTGKAQPLFGSPTLSLLQQQVLNSLNAQNPSGYLDPISTNTGTTLSGKIFLTVGNGKQSEIDVPPSPNNTLQGLADAITAVGAPTPIACSGTAGSDGVTSNGTLSVSSTAKVGGSITIQVGAGKAYTVDVPSDSPNNSLEGLAATINSTAGIGVTAGYQIVNGVTTMTLTSNTSGSDGTLHVTSNVVIPGPGFSANVETSNGTSYLMLQSGTAGSSGVLSVTSELNAISQAPLAYASAGTSSTTSPDSGNLGSGIGATDSLTGSVSIQVGSGSATTISMSSLTDQTLSGLADAINKAGLGVTAGINNSGGITLTSQTDGNDGTLSITSNLLDPSITSTKALNYTNSSDIAAITSLGISLKNDGTMIFDATNLDTLLNTDFSGVVGLFQNVNSWGRNFSSMLAGAGTSSSTGILKLAQVSNSNIESTLNADISKQESLISAQQKSLMAELNSANEILQSLPSQLDGINQIYSAITGYNQGQH